MAHPLKRPSARPRAADGGETIDFWCRYVNRGWMPYDLDRALDEEIEALVLLASNLAGRGYPVRVYHNQPGPGRELVHRGVRFCPHGWFKPQEPRRALVAWKSANPWALGAQAGVRLQVRGPQNLSGMAGGAKSPGPVEKILPGKPRGGLRWESQPLAPMAGLPLGLDGGLLNLCRQPKRAGRVFYDGPVGSWLIRWLEAWPQARQQTGCRRLDLFLRPTPAALRLELAPLLAQPGVVAHWEASRMERLEAGWRAGVWWMAPLADPDGRLLALAKAAHCRALAVVADAGPPGAGRWLRHHGWLAGLPESDKTPSPLLPDWDQVVTGFWEPLI